jgi:hypothetical protein
VTNGLTSEALIAYQQKKKQITVCAPAAARGSEPSQPQLCKIPMPVHLTVADEEGDGYVRGLAFDDFSRMNVQTSAVRTLVRRCPTPAWALTESSTRRVILAFMEKRAFSKKKRAALTGTDRERFVNVMAALKSRRDNHIKVLDGLCNQFVICQDDARRKELTTQIQNLDRVLRMLGNPFLYYELVTAYHREHEDSVAVAERCGLSPWGVRALLRRMNLCARELGYTVEFSKQSDEQKALAEEQKRRTKLERQAVRAARRQQRLAKRYPTRGLWAKEDWARWRENIKKGWARRRAQAQ